MNKTITGESPEEDFQISGTVLTKYIGNESKVSIPMYIQGKAITVIGEGAFSHCTTVDYVECSLTTKEIGESAFAYSSVKVVRLQHGVKKIGNFAFAHCPRLMQVILNPDLQELGEEVFTHCPSLLGMKCSNQIKSMGQGIFAHCGKLKYLELSQKLLTVPDHAFKGCSSLEFLSLPFALEHIGSFAFAETGLRFLQLPPYVSTLGEGAFFACSALEQLNLPDSLQSLGKDVFSGCSKLIIRYFPANLPWSPEDFAQTALTPELFAMITAQQYEIEESPLCYVLNKGEIQSYHGDYGAVSIPPVVLRAEISSLKQGLFQGQTQLTSLRLPATICQLSPLDFFACRGLEEISFPCLLKELPTMCCSECFSLKTILFPPMLEKIGFSAFSHNRSLETVALPETVLLVAEQAFAYNNKLKAVYLPSSLLYLDPDVFLGCNPTLQIYGRRGSLAEQLAVEQGFPFCTVLGDVPELFL